MASSLLNDHKGLCTVMIFAPLIIARPIHIPGYYPLASDRIAYASYLCGPAAHQARCEGLGISLVTYNKKDPGPILRYSVNTVTYLLASGTVKSVSKPS